MIYKTHANLKRCSNVTTCHGSHCFFFFFFPPLTFTICYIWHTIYPLPMVKMIKMKLKQWWYGSRIFFCTEQLAGGYTTIDNMPYGIYDVKIWKILKNYHFVGAYGIHVVRCSSQKSLISVTWGKGFNMRNKGLKN